MTERWQILFEEYRKYGEEKEGVELTPWRIILKMNFSNHNYYSCYRITLYVGRCTVYPIVDETHVATLKTKLNSMSGKYSKKRF